jgi:cytochrome c5
MPNEALHVLIASATILSGCTASQSTPKSSNSAQIGEVPADMQSDYESFAVNCSKCHDTARALAAPVTDHKHWDIYVAKMMRTAGSAISAHEAPHILRFLYWYTDHKLGRVDNDNAKTSQTSPAPAAKAAATHEVVPPASSPAVTPLAPSVSSETQGEGAP